MEEEKKELMSWRIDSEYKLEGDDLNVTLSKRRAKKEGDSASKSKEESWSVVGYFPDVAMALKYYCIENINGSLASAEAIMEEIDTLYSLLEEVGKKVEDFIKINK